MNQYFTNFKDGIVTSDRVLYTPSTFARTSLLHLQEIGELEAKMEHTSSRSGLQSYLYFTVLGGSGVLSYDGEEYELSAGSCVFIDCKKSYSHTTDADDLWKLRWIHFYGPTAASIYDKYCERGGRPVFIPDSSGDFDELWTKLMKAANSSDYLRDMKINALLSDLLVCIMAESWHPEDKVQAKKRQSVLAVKAYIDENYSAKITLDDLSARFYISKYYLTHSFKEQFGQTLNNYLLSVRITKAKQLLRFSNKTVEEIGYATGIGAPQYFSSVFKKVEGMSPKKYREQW